MLKRTAGLLHNRIEDAGIGPGNGLTSFEPGVLVPSDERVRAQPTVQDALTAARRALAAAKAHAEGSRALESENYPVAEIVARLDRRIEALEPGRGVSTEEWFAELPAPERRVTLFLALLELARLQRIFGVMPVSLRNVVPKWLWLEKPISSEMSARLICVAGDRSSLDLAADQALVFCPADQQVLFGGRQTQVAGVLCLHRRQ